MYVRPVSWQCNAHRRKIHSGFIIFVVASTTFTGLCAALVTSAFFIGLYGALSTHVFLGLGFTVWIRLGTILSMLAVLLAALSVWISTGMVIAYILWRLFTLVRTDGRAGVRQWSTETRGRFRRQKKVETEERRGRSPESVVLVKEGGNRTPPDGPTKQ